MTAMTSIEVPDVTGTSDRKKTSNVHLAVSKWWRRYLRDGAVGANTLRAKLRSRTDAELFLAPEVSDLLISVAETQGHRVDLKQCERLIGLARLIGPIRAEADRRIGEQIARSTISDARLRNIVTSPDQAALSSALRQALPFIENRADIASVARLYLSWPKEEARNRFAFDIYENRSK